MNPFEENLLKYFKPDQLQKIQSKKIGIGGAGGLGSNVAVILTRCGFKHFEILDDDKIEYSNLNRQFYFVNEVGENKVTTLSNRLLQINPECKIQALPVHWSAAIGDQLFQKCDFIVEAFDKAETKHDFVSFYQTRTPYIISGIGMAGLMQKKPFTHKKLDNIHMIGDFTTDTSQGHPPLAPRVIACAALMAEKILDLTCGVPSLK